MNDKEKSMSSNWLEILNKNVVFLNKSIDILKTYRELVDSEPLFVSRVDFVKKIDESMRDLLVAKNKLISFAKKKCVSGSIPAECVGKVDDLASCMNSASQKFSVICLEATRKLKEANYCERENFED